MLVAALDTSTLVLSCALCESAGGQLRLIRECTSCASAKPGPQGPTGGHGGRLPGVFLELLSAAGVKLSDVGAYAIGLGPGSFTGLRIGLATWKGLAYAHQRPIAGASSLAAMALAAAAEGGAGELLVPLLDAKKGEVYAGFYRVTSEMNVEQVQPDAALPPTALLARVEALAKDGPAPQLFGPGLAAYPDVLGRAPSRRTEVREPSAQALARLCAGALEGATYDAAKLFALEPHYVRPCEAELKFPNGFVAPRP